MRRNFLTKHGLLEICVEGLNIEKFISLCISNGIELMNMKRTNYSTLFALIHATDFSLVAKINKRLKCRIRITKRKGAIFTAARCVKRFSIPLGLVLFVAMILFFSSFILKINIRGIERIEVGSILDTLKSEGVYIASLRKNVDPTKLELRLLKEHEDIKWIHISLDGCVLDISLTESTLGEDIKSQTPHHIVADFDCEIISINVLSGKGMVGVGDTVKKGDILVSGHIKNEDPPYEYTVPAEAEIKGYLTYSGEYTADFAQGSTKFKTGNTFVRKYVKIHNIALGSNKEIPFESYELTVREQHVYSYGQLIPIYVVREEYSELTDSPSPEQLSSFEEELITMAYRDALKSMPVDAQIISRSALITCQNGVYTAQAEVKATKNIGINMDILSIE